MSTQPSKCKKKDQIKKLLQFNIRSNLKVGQEYSLRDLADASRYRMRLISDHINQAIS